MRGSGLALLLILMVPVQAHAQYPHLVPEVSALADREESRQLLSRLFNSSGYDSDIRARMVLRPSFGGRPWHTGIRQTQTGYEIFFGQPDQSLWEIRPDSGTAGRLSKWAAEAKMTRRTVPIDSSAAQEVASVWKEAILRTRYPRGDLYIVMDGVGAHFSRWVHGRGMISGTTHSPPSGSVASALMSLGILIARHAQEKGATQSQIREKADQLQTLLSENK